MAVTAHHKLVRDRIPEIIEASGRSARVQVLGPAEASSALLVKLAEEAAELATATGDAAVRSELADLLEVVRGLAAEHGVEWDTVLGDADAKREERGGFTRRLFLVDVTGDPYDGE